MAHVILGLLLGYVLAAICGSARRGAVMAMAMVCGWEAIAWALHSATSDPLDKITDALFMASGAGSRSDLRRALDRKRGAFMSLSAILDRIFSEPHASYWLRRTAGAQEAFAVYLGIVGVCAFVVARVAPFPMLPMAIYGHFVISIDADIWSVPLMLGSAGWYFGVHLNGHSPRVSSSFRFGSNVILASVFVFFVAGSLPYAGPDFFVISCAAMGAFMAFFACLNALDLIGAVRLAGGRNE